MNSNGNSNLTITDIYLIFKKINGNQWPTGIPNYRIFTQSEWSNINSSSANLLSTYSGVQTMTISSPVAGGNTNFYLIRTGYSN
jgi:hypothetical protein